MNLSELSKYSIIIVLFPALFTGFFPGKIVVVQALSFYLLTYVYWLNRKQWHKEEFDGGIVFLLVFAWSLIIYIRGFWNIDWLPDWYNQFSGLFFLCFTFPMLLYAPNTYNLKYIYQGFLSFGLLICIINAILPPSDGAMEFQHNMYFMCGFALIIPYVKKRYRCLIMVSLFVMVFYDIDRRSVLVNVSISLFILMYYQLFKGKIFRKLLVWTFILSPLFFLFLGLTGTFNFFEEMGESDSSIQLSKEGRSLSTDSRSGIYLDVLSEIDNQKAYWFGLGGNGKTETHIITTASNGDEYAEQYKYGRPGTESGMLNNIQYGGILGLIVFSLLYIVAALRASNHSNNEYMRMLGAFVAFKYLYSFVEDRLGAQGSSYYLFLWIGMCYNTKFRGMNDNEMKGYLKQIFK